MFYIVSKNIEKGGEEVKLKIKNFKSVTFMVIVFFHATLLLMSRALIVNATVQPESNFYVTDYQNILNEDVRNHIIAVNQLFEQTNERPQIAVVVVDSLKGQTVEQYALEQFERMGIGNSKYDNGLLVLLATQDRKIRIEVGYGLEGAIPDAKAGRIIDASMSELRVGDYSKAIEDIFNRTVLEVQNEYGYENVLGDKIVADVGMVNCVLAALTMCIILISFFGLEFAYDFNESRKEGHDNSLQIKSLCNAPKKNYLLVLPRALAIGVVLFVLKVVHKIKKISKEEYAINKRRAINLITYQKVSDRIIVLIIIFCLVFLQEWLGNSETLPGALIMAGIALYIFVFRESYTNEFTDSELIVHAKRKKNRTRMIAYEDITRVDVIETKRSRESDFKTKYTYSFKIYGLNNEWFLDITTPECENKEDERIRNIIQDLSKIGEVFQKGFSERKVEEVILSDYEYSGGSSHGGFGGGGSSGGGGASRSF